MAFKYKERSKEAVEKRKNQQGINRDPMFKEGITIFKPKDKENKIRFLPPTWEDADHYGYDLFIHYNIGGEKASYLCNKVMKNEDDPMCEESKRLEIDGEIDDSKALKSKKRVLTFVIDRDNEEAGPQLWPEPWTLDRDIAVLGTDDTTGEPLPLDSPTKGYDVYFSKKGTGVNTEYFGVKIARKETPLHPSEKMIEKWLAFVEKNPIPSTLIFYDYSYLEKVFSGHSYDNKEDEPEKEKAASKEADKPVEKEVKKEKETAKETTDEGITYDSILDLSEEDLKELAKDNGIPSVMIKKMSYDELVESVCESVGIEVQPKDPEPEPEPEVKNQSIKDRLAEKLKNKGK